LLPRALTRPDWPPCWSRRAWWGEQAQTRRQVALAGYTRSQPARTQGDANLKKNILEPILSEADLLAELADALDDTSFDAELRRETDEALALTGKDVGTPIIHFQPPGGVAFFGPVISRLPSEAEAVPLWDNVLGLASFPGFAELKRSLRERPQLRGFGVEPGRIGVQEDWYAGRRHAPR
jgi:hypothetical protein